MTEVVEKPRLIPLSDAFPNSLISRLKRGELTMEQFILDKSTYNPIRRNQKTLTDFVVNNIDEFIDILLNSTSHILKTNALKILRSGNKNIVQAVASSDKILEFSETLNEKSDFTGFPLIIEICLNQCPLTVSETFSFLPQLIKYADRISINYMFEKVLQKIDFLSPIHYFLKMNDFPNYVATTALTSNDEMKYSLFKILTFCLENPILESISTGQPTIELLQQCVRNEENHLRAIAWKFAEEALLLQDSDETLSSILLNDCIEAITNASVKIYYEYQVNALIFLTKLISLNPTTCTNIDLDSLIGSLTQILENFPSHSIALTAVFQFVKMGIDCSYTRTTIMTTFVPAVMRILNEPEHVIRTQWAFCVTFLQDLKTLSMQDEFLNDEITPEIREDFRISDEFESKIHPSKSNKAFEYFNDMIGMNLQCIRPNRIVSSQDL